MIVPNSLCEGDTIGIVAPAGPLRVCLHEIKSSIEMHGYKVKIGRSCYLNYKGYLAGKDEDRAKDINDMFLDSEVNAIMCLRGGFGATRILDMINYDIVKRNPKIFIGFSDITALHIAFNQKCDLLTYHGIMAASSPRWDEFTYNSLINALNFNDKLSIKNPIGESIYTIKSGYCEGILVGGNLSLIVSTLGTKYEINTKNKILFIEEVGEYIYRIDRMLTHLSLAGKLSDCNGIIFGDFSDCRKSNEYDPNIYDLLSEVSLKANKPAIYNLKSGHCMPMVTIPLGAYCIMDADRKKIEFRR